MNTDNIPVVRDLLAQWGITPVMAGIAVAAALLLLIAAAALLRRIGRGGAATYVTTFSTVLGLGWSAQGMWDTAVHHYDQTIVVASVLFVVFEAWIVGRMLRAHQYRADYKRRGRFVRAVWTGAAVMALVVALGEGWTQAPGRLAIPLLVTYGWYTDLTADDDPDEKPPTSLRWTPRRLALWIGMLEAGERDAQTIDRDRLRDRMTRLAFRIKYGAQPANDLFRRTTRLAKLKTMADDADLTEVRARLARMDINLMAAPDPVLAPPAASSIDVPPTRRIRPAADSDRRVMGVHVIDGLRLRGADLHRDGVRRLLESVSPDRPRGMTNDELAKLYAPPLGGRTAEKIGAEARRQINGNVPAGDLAHD